MFNLTNYFESSDDDDQDVVVIPKEIKYTNQTK